VSPLLLLQHLEKSGIKVLLLSPHSVWPNDPPSQPTTALLAQVKVFQTAPSRKKKLVVLKRMAGATKKSTLRAIRKDVTARASVAFDQKKSSQLARVLSTDPSNAFDSEFDESTATDSVP
jgi:hypothetical protein